jgi:F-type H+-transporting ATPase subunit epsilon
MAGETFVLDLVTPERTFFSGPVQEFVAPGVLGEFGVLPGHASMLAELTTGRLRYRDASGEKVLVTAGGFAEVTGTKVTALLDNALFVEELDPAELDRQIADLEAGAPAAEDEGFGEWEKRIAWRRFCREQCK